jgi:hypothetical protein
MKFTLNPVFIQFLEIPEPRESSGLKNQNIPIDN